MSREKQNSGSCKISNNHIEEMANFLWKNTLIHTEDLCHDVSETCYNAGYRKQEWISVDERLPEPNKLVLCIWEREDDGWNYGFARYQRENVWYVSNEGMPRVTHWMPLPEPPKMKGGAE